MKKFLFVLVGLVVVVGLWSMSTYNGLVDGQEKVTARWSEVENMYKRRFDLIPQLVETVKGAADYEKTTLQEVVDARASVGRVQLPEGLPTDPEALQAYMSAQQGLGGALGRLFAVSEAYPTLRASESFLTLQSQIEGSENRIAVARGDFIDAVRVYNSARRKFPGFLFVNMGWGDFEEAAVLPAEEGTHDAPAIDFGGEGN